LLLIVAWQYRFRYAVLYTLLISGLEWLMVLNADTPDHLGAAINSNSLITRAIIYLLVGYIVTGLMSRQRQQHHQLETANQRQAESNAKLAHYAATIEQLSTSRERNRLARELHDTLAHSLSALSVQLEAVSALWKVDPAAARKMLTQADETTRTGLTEARRALQALRAAPLEESGLALALRDAAQVAAKRGDLRLDLDVPELATTLPPAVEQGVYRIAQEALENVVRHARASRLSVKLACTLPDLELSIRDDGLGFAPDAQNGDSNRFGLRGMRERAAMLGATLQINSQPGQGAHICLKLELDQ
jgi:signal transduction histidine kinase